jgi:hypothetical protein
MAGRLASRGEAARRSVKSVGSERGGRLGLDRNALRAKLGRGLLHDLARFVGKTRGIVDVPLFSSHRSDDNSVLGSAKEPRTLQYRRQSLVEQPLSPRDYDVPVGWWGWNWEPPIPMSVTELLEARNMDSRTAALCGMVLEAHGSLLIAAEQPHSGKTTTLTAFLDFLPNRVRRVFLRGWVETFDYLKQTTPADTILLGNELSSHLPVYLWGPKAVRAFETLRKGYAIGSTLHADSAEESVAQLTGELGVAPSDLARVDLLMVMRVYATPRGQYVRRVVSLHRLTPRDGSGPRLLPLVEHDERTDRHEHALDAELDLLADRRGGDRAAMEAELARRCAFLDELMRRRCREIPDVRAALAEYRGERAPIEMRGDPTV